MTSGMRLHLGGFRFSQGVILMFINRRKSLAGAVSVAFLPTFIAAQSDDDSGSDASDLLTQIPGLVSAYARRYVPSDAVDFVDWPLEPTEATPHYLLIMALEFESEATLIGVTEAMLNTDIAGVILGEPGPRLTDTGVADLPEGNRLFTYTDETASHTKYESLLVVAAENYAFLLVGRGGSDAIQVTINGIAADLVKQDIPESEIVVEAEGVASGGVFDIFPGMDDVEILSGLVPFFDYDVLVSDSPILPASATPAATPSH